MAELVAIAKNDKPKSLLVVANPPPKTKRTYKATAALEKKLREAKNSKELDCPPDFFTKPLDD